MLMTPVACKHAWDLLLPAVWQHFLTIGSMIWALLSTLKRVPGWCFNWIEMHIKGGKLNC